jgi:hypothetical protein
MQLFYTTVEREGQTQTDPLYSLGGYCSSTPVPSGVDENLFSLFSQLSIETNKPMYICLVLKNILSVECTGIFLYFDDVNLSTRWGKYRVALVNKGADGLYEHIGGIYERPKYATFQEIDGEANKMAVPNMQPGEMYGLWVERTLNTEADEVKNRNDVKYLYSHRNDVLQAKENVDLVVEFEG